MEKNARKEVRHRICGTENLPNSVQNGIQIAKQTKKLPSRYLSERIFAYILVYVLALFALASWSYHRLPPAKTVAEHGSTGEFVEERARAHVAAITGLGPRPAGSRANEVYCVEYLMKTLADIKKMAVPGVHELEIDISHPEGSFTMSFWGGFTSYYKKITNIVVRLSPAQEVARQGEGDDDHSLLLNGHFDTVAGSPGASDDAASCGIMLEILQNLATSPRPLRHSIIFLFNGAEENILQASHGFITQHPWRKNIKAFLNLEAAGAGGRELVFQTGPDHPWLLRAYAQHAVHPFATIIGQDVFQGELIPADTDFRIFRDFGHIPGVDMAYVSNGYVYHTKYDNLDSIPPGCIQRAGDNIQAIATHLANSSTLHNGIHDDRHGNMVFFDLLGFVMVAYPVRVGNILNWVVVVAAVLSILFRRRQEFANHRTYLTKLLSAVSVILVSYIAVLAMSAFVIIVITVTKSEMSWYAHPAVIVGLYWAPSVYILIVVHRSLGAKLHTADSKTNPWILERLFFDANLLIWSLIVAVLTLKRFGSAYLPMLSIAFAVVGRVLLGRRMASLQGGAKTSLVLTAYICMTCVPLTLSLYLILLGYEIFLPILGRSGALITPEIFVGFLTSIMVVICTNFLICLIHSCRTLKYTRAFLLVVFMATLAVVISCVVFPYSGDPSNPAPKRLLFEHISRTNHDQSGAVVDHDTYLSITPLDYLGIRHLESHIPALETATLAECRKDMPYCGHPSYLHFLHVFRNQWLLPAKEPPIEVQTTFKLNSRIKKSDHHNLTFTVSGPSHINLFITLRDGVELAKWSLSKELPLKTLDGHGGWVYFVCYGGGEPEDWWKFWMDLKVPESFQDSDPVIDIGVAGLHYTDFELSQELKSVLSQEPDWVYSIPFLAVYDSWTF